MIRFCLISNLAIIIRRYRREITDISNPSGILSEEPVRQTSTPGLCSRKTVRINFDDIGWTHILAPKEVST